MNPAFWRAAGIRALRTLAQTALGVIGTTALIEQVQWEVVGSAAGLAAVLSVLTSLAGLPEAPKTAALIDRPDPFVKSLGDEPPTT